MQPSQRNLRVNDLALLLDKKRFLSQRHSISLMARLWLGKSDRSRFERGTNFSDLQVTYGPDGAGFVAQSCNMTKPHTEVTCFTAPGAGMNHSWRVVHDSSISLPSTDMTSYVPPTLISVTPEYDKTDDCPTATLAAEHDYACTGTPGFGTAGGETVVLRGRNFGPLGFEVSATYAKPEGSGFDLGSTLAGSTLIAIGCIVIEADSVVTCAAGSGGRRGCTRGRRHLAPLG